MEALCIAVDAAVAICAVGSCHAHLAGCLVGVRLGAGSTLDQTHAIRPDEACRAILTTEQVCSWLRADATRRAQASRPSSAFRTRNAGRLAIVVRLAVVAGRAQPVSAHGPVRTRHAATCVRDRRGPSTARDAGAAVAAERAVFAPIAVIGVGVWLLPRRTCRARLHVQSAFRLVIVSMRAVHTPEAVRGAGIKHDRVWLESDCTVLAAHAGVRKFARHADVTDGALGIWSPTTGTGLARHASGRDPSTAAVER